MPLPGIAQYWFNVEGTWVLYIFSGIKIIQALASKTSSDRGRAEVAAGASRLKAHPPGLGPGSTQTKRSRFVCRIGSEPVDRRSARPGTAKHGRGSWLCRAVPGQPGCVGGGVVGEFRGGHLSPFGTRAFVVCLTGLRRQGSHVEHHRRLAGETEGGVRRCSSRGRFAKFIILLHVCSATGDYHRCFEGPLELDIEAL
jgi:hypothetical protein